MAVTLLWALRSPCNLSCRYCYFGTVEEHRSSGRPIQAGALSHLSSDDLGLAEILAFTATLADPASPVRRIFIAGGEPLIWPPVMDVVESIRAVGVEVVLCTNGIPLSRPDLAARIIELGVAAVSVSLDSTDPEANDRYRPSRNGAAGWTRVLAGLGTLLDSRGDRDFPKIGLYTVVTRQNIDEIVRVGRLAAEIGCDYYVPQPISLPTDHALHAELSLTARQVPALRLALAELYDSGLRVSLPPASYPPRFRTSVQTSLPGFVPDCFGGRELFFVEPDGSVWDCPSALKIALTPRERWRNIAGGRAAEVFARSECGDCDLFSSDCVNMWPLMDFWAFAIADGAAA